MDNMKYYNDSLAYDFDMFMPHPKEERTDNIVRMPKQMHERRPAKQAVRKLSVSFFAVMTAVFMLAAFCGNILLRLQINEVNAQIGDVKKQIDELDSVKTSLSVELDRRISYSNVELEATELGMVKRSKDQVRYIRVNDKNTARTGDGKIVTARK